MRRNRGQGGSSHGKEKRPKRRKGEPTETLEEEATEETWKERKRKEENEEEATEETEGKKEEREKDPNNAKEQGGGVEEQQGLRCGEANPNQGLGGVLKIQRGEQTRDMMRDLMMKGSWD